MSSPLEQAISYMQLAMEHTTIAMGRLGEIATGLEGWAMATNVVGDKIDDAMGRQGYVRYEVGEAYAAATEAVNAMEQIAGLLGKVALHARDALALSSDAGQDISGVTSLTGELASALGGAGGDSLTAVARDAKQQTHDAAHNYAYATEDTPTPEATQHMIHVDGLATQTVPFAASEATNTHEMLAVVAAETDEAVTGQLPTGVGADLLSEIAAAFFVKLHELRTQLGQQRELSDRVLSAMNEVKIQQAVLTNAVALAHKEAGEMQTEAAQVKGLAERRLEAWLRGGSLNG